MADDRPHALIAEQQRVRGSRAATARALTRRRFRRRVLPPLAVTSAVLLGTGGASAWVYGAIEHKASTPTGSNADDQLSTLEQLRAQLAADQQALASIAGAAPAGSAAAATSPSTDGSMSAAGQPLATTPSTDGSMSAAGQPLTTPSGTTPKGQPAPTRAAVGTSKTAGTVNAGGPAGTAVTTHAPAAGQTQPAAGQPQPPAAQPTANPGTPTQAPKPAPAPVPSATAPAPAPKPPPPPPAPTPTVHATSGASGG